MEQIEIKKLTHKDVDKFTELIRVFEDVFEMKNLSMPGQAYLQELLDQDSFFVFVGMSVNRVVAGLTAYTLKQYYCKLPVVYIYDLAVATEFQRHGIGRSLIAALTSYCKETGVQEVFVQADLVDDYALEFYRSTGATEEEVVHFTYSLNDVAS